MLLISYFIVCFIYIDIHKPDIILRQLIYTYYTFVQGGFLNW